MNDNKLRGKPCSLLQLMDAGPVLLTWVKLSTDRGAADRQKFAGLLRLRGAHQAGDFLAVLEQHPSWPCFDFVRAPQCPARTVFHAPMAQARDSVQHFSRRVLSRLAVTAPVGAKVQQQPAWRALNDAALGLFGQI